MGAKKAWGQQDHCGAKKAWGLQYHCAAAGAWGGCRSMGG